MNLYIKVQNDIELILLRNRINPKKIDMTQYTDMIMFLIENIRDETIKTAEDYYFYLFNEFELTTKNNEYLWINVFNEKYIELNENGIFKIIE